MGDDNFTNIFKQNSTTYFFSSLFFPKQIRQQVTTLYAFVRTADDFVDQMPPKRKEFFAFFDECARIRQGKTTKNPIINAFNELEQSCNFNKKWTQAFLESMEMDLTKKRYQTLKDLERYMYGSAGVIGLMMAKIMQLPEAALPAAQLQGKSMQFINFIRDVEEDNQLGRTYLPQQDLKKFGLKNVLSESVVANRNAFSELIRFEIARYETWQTEAKKGYKYIPRPYRIPIQTAAEMYEWTAEQIYKNPTVVFEKKIKPSKAQVLLAGMKYTLKSLAIPPK